MSNDVDIFGMQKLEIVVVKEPKTVQTALRLPSDLYDRLKTGPLGVSEEIRRRLVKSFKDQDSYDERTRALGETVMQLDRLIEVNSGFKWTAHPKAQRALIEAIGFYLREGANIDLRKIDDDAFEDDPYTLGKWLARFLLGKRREQEEEGPI
jgi:hypothetical protein